MSADVSAPPEVPTAPSLVFVVRIHAADRAWLRWLPPVPGGATVTVSVTESALADIAPDDLIGTGYQLVGIVSSGPVRGSTGAVDLVVPHALAIREPGWWRTLQAIADRAMDPAFGPVARALAPVLALHALHAVPDPDAHQAR